MKVQLWLPVCLSVHVLARKKTKLPSTEGGSAAPAPTTPPSFGQVAELRKRAVTDTCGYLSDGSWSYYCVPGDVCGYNPASSAFGCCASVSGSSAYDCFFPTTCADYGQITGTLDATQVWETYSCSSSEYPYCETFFEGSMSAYGCNAYPSQTAVLQATLNLGTNTASTTSRTRTSTSTAFSQSVPTASGPTNNVGGTTPVVGSTVTSTFSQSQATGTASQQSASSSGNGAVMMSSRVEAWGWTVLLAWMWW